MIKILESLKAQKKIGYLVFFVNLLIYLPILLFKSPAVSLDYNLVIAPLEDIRGPVDYWHKFIEHKILDLNPIRDISHLIDLMIFSHTGFDPSLIVNYLLFLLVLFLFFKITNISTNKKISIILTCLLSVHPIFVSIISIITWRKHLLSAVFTLTAIYLLQQNKGRLKAWIFYMLSLLSQPINIGISAWLVIKDRFMAKMSWTQALKRNLPFLLSSLFIAIANLYYYKYIMEGIQQFTKYFDGNWGDRLLSIGRSFYQILFPTSYTLFYYRASIENFIGLILLVVLLFITYKNKKKTDLFIYWFLFFINLLVINFQTTTVFLFDAYLIIPTIAIFFIISKLISDKVLSRSINLIFLLLYFLLASKSFWESFLRTDTFRFYQTHYKREPACGVTAKYLQLLILKDEVKEFQDVAQDALVRNCLQITPANSEYLFLIIAYQFYLSRNFEISEKISLIQNKKTKNFLDQLILFSLSIQIQDKNLINESLQNISHNITAFKKLNQTYPKLRIITDIKKNQSKLPHKVQREIQQLFK